MVQPGFTFSAEKHPSMDLVKNAQQAEEVSFSFAMNLDHIHVAIIAQAAATTAAMVPRRFMLGGG